MTIVDCGMPFDAFIHNMANFVVLAYAMIKELVEE